MLGRSLIPKTKSHRSVLWQRFQLLPNTNNFAQRPPSICKTKHLSEELKHLGKIFHAIVYLNVKIVHKQYTHDEDINQETDQFSSYVSFLCFENITDDISCLLISLNIRTSVKPICVCVSIQFIAHGARFMLELLKYQN